MRNTNRVLLVGQLTADPQAQLENEIPKATFRLATNYSWKNAEGEWQNGVDFHSVVAWRNLAEQITPYKKGETVLVEGRLRSNNWLAENGERKFRIEIVANTIYGVQLKKGEQTEAILPDDVEVLAE